MNTAIYIKEVSAEMWLNYLYPELESRWIAQHRGTFYRNYNEDVLEVDPDNCKVTITRDGYLKLLPEGLLTADDELKGRGAKENIETLQRRIQILNEAFLPFDTFAFRNKLRIEREISALLSTKLEFILSQYFKYDLSLETDKYVRELAVMLPYVNRLRADFAFIQEALAAILDCNVVMSRGNYSVIDDTLCRQPMIKYELIVEGLDAKAYSEMKSSLAPLCQFIREWFIPFEFYLAISIKCHTNPFTIGENLILEYNTEITS